MIYVTGDCHADFTRFNTKIFPEQYEMTKDDYVIICGDFGGVWNRFEENKHEKHWMDWLEDRPFTTLFCEGNHENFDRLYSYPVEKWNGGNVHKIRPSVIHLMRGQVFQLCGKKFFVFGGAKSHDIDGGILDPEAPDFKKKKKQKEIDELQMKILSSRRLLDGEVKVLLDYLAENAQQVEMSVDNIDDWAYDKNFVGKLSHYVGKETLKIKYQSSNNIGKAIERIKQGLDVAEYKKHEHGYFICWKFDDIYEIYGLPSEQIAIDRDTTCIVVDYYLRNLNSSV